MTYIIPMNGLWWWSEAANNLPYAATLGNFAKKIEMDGEIRSATHLIATTSERAVCELATLHAVWNIFDQIRIVIISISCKTCTLKIDEPGRTAVLGLFHVLLSYYDLQVVYHTPRIRSILVNGERSGQYLPPPAISTDLETHQVNWSQKSEYNPEVPTEWTLTV